MDKKKQIPTDSTQQEPYISGLTPIQEKAAIMLASGESVTSVADSLNLNRTTIYQWQQKVTFQCFFNVQRAEVSQNLRNGLVALYQDALQAVRDVLKSDNDGAKLKAAMLVISKVETTSVGATDAKALLRKQATEEINPLKDLGFEPYTEFNEEKYHQLLVENGFED